ncbi:sacsin N-terminal ATP-binding-like domain-containing protein [Blastococcus sp. SYSU DS1024]
MAASTPGNPRDPFGTAGLRRRVLAAWADSPARFREDANAEEDLVRGGYRDRLLVELAQNAADAALRAGVPGRLRLLLAGDELRAANTGAPLDAGGVVGLATLRASAKRDDPAAVGRFGVGFAAVLAVSDEPVVLSRTGGVRFSAGRTRAEVEALPEPAAELAHRDGAVPVLRLPWPAAGALPEGYDTEVVLPLRPGARDGVVAALRALPAELLLALPGLAVVEVVVEGARRVLIREGSAPEVRLTEDGVPTRWALAERSGRLPPQLLAGRPVEERERRAWTVTWAVPLDEAGRPRPLPGRQVVHAPTPTDEPLSLPLRLLAPFPLGPDRRHVLPGPVTDLLVAESAQALADLVAGLPADPALLTVLPRPGLAGAALDAALSGAALDRLRATAWLPVAGEPGERQPPTRAVVLDDATAEQVAAVTGVLPGLLPAGWSRRTDGPVLAALEVRRAGLADVVEAVRQVARPAGWWAELYAAFADADREELAALPVPLADGRTAHGPAGVLLPEPGLPVERLAALPLRLADPAAAGPRPARRLLERLGARPATATAVLGDPAVRATVAGSLDAAEEDVAGAPGPEELADAVLALVAAAPDVAGAPWLAELALPDAAGGYAPAGELLLPGSPLAAVLEEGALGVLDPAFATEADVEALRAVGVLDRFALVRADDPDELDVDGALDWADAVLDRLAGEEPPVWPPLVAVRDLELVADWPGALALLATAPAEAWADVVVGGVPVPGYLRWWLLTHPVLDGHRPDRLAHPGSTELAGLYDPAPLGEPLLGLLRPPAVLADVLVDPDGARDLLDRLADPARTVAPAVLRTVHARLAAALDGWDVEPPPRVRVAPDRVVERAVVLDAPHLLPLVDLPVVPAGGAPGPVADLLDLPLAGELVRRPRVTSEPRYRSAWAEVPGAGLAAARLGRAALTGSVAVHAPLTVDGRPVPWWPADDVDHVDGTPGALGRALAWRSGAWGLRQALAEAFALPDRAPDLAAEDAVGW